MSSTAKTSASSPMMFMVRVLLCVRSAGSGHASAQRLGHPIGDVVARVDAVVEARVLSPAFAFGEDLQLALRAVDELVVGALRPLQRDLRVLLAMGDEERHA